MTALPIVSVSVIVVGLLGWRVFRMCQAANEADWGHPLLNGIDGLNRILCHRYHRLRHDSINLPRQGPALLVSNHVSGLDPLLMIAACRRPLRFIIATEEFERYGLNWLYKSVGCIPVDRSARPEQALRAALRALEQGEVIALFPHGRIHLDNHPPRKLKGGVAWLARRTASPIHPLRIAGIRGHGQVLTAVVMRSRATVTAYPPVYCHDADHDDCLEQLAAFIEGRAEKPYGVPPLTG